MSPVSRIGEWPAEERPRERLYFKGPDSLADAELLALQLGTGTRGQTAVDLAREMLAQYGSLSGLAGRGVGELMRVRGVGRAKAVRLAATGVVAVFWWVNQLGNKWVLAPGVALLLWAVPPARRRWWLWLAVLIAAPVLEDLGKQVVGRPRPVGNAFGFPSGHVTAATAYFFLAAYLIGQRLSTPERRRIILWVIAGLTVALVGVARIVLQAHWPADAIGGAALGLACVSLAAWWHERQGGGRGGAT